MTDEQIDEQAKKCFEQIVYLLDDYNGGVKPYGMSAAQTRLANYGRSMYKKGLEARKSNGIPTCGECGEMYHGITDCAERCPGCKNVKPGRRWDDSCINH